MEDHGLKNKTIVDTFTPPLSQSTELKDPKSPEILEKVENQSQSGKSRWENFKRWLKRFLSPTAFCAAIIALCTIIYTITMVFYTNYTYGLLKSTQEGN